MLIPTSGCLRTCTHSSALNRSGFAYVTPAKIEDGWMVRVSIGAPETEVADVEALWSAMMRFAERAS